MKITGYTIIGTIVLILIIYGLIQFELSLYEKAIKYDKYDDLFGFNSIIFILLFAILGLTGCFDKLHKLLKKRIL